MARHITSAFPTSFVPVHAEIRTTIPAAMSEPRISRPPVQAEPKARGANRSTKVAGKLKVLPEQPDNLPSFRSEGVALRTKPIKDHLDNVEATGDSDEADIDEDDDEQEDEIEVNSILLSASFFPDFVANSGVQSNLINT